MGSMEVRPSMSILVVKIIGIELIAAVFYLLFISINKAYPGVFVDLENRAIIEIYAFSILLAIRLMAIIYVVYAWKNTEYICTPQELTVKRGVLTKTVRRYSLLHVESVTAYTPVLGGILGYGVVNIKMRLNDSYICLPYMAEPGKIAEGITKLATAATASSDQALGPVFQTASPFMQTQSPAFETSGKQNVL